MLRAEYNFCADNRLLSNMRPELFAVLEPHLEIVTLQRNHLIDSYNDPISDVCFPGKGVVSVVVRTAGGVQLATGLIGPEGMTGISLLYGVESTPHETSVQIPCRVMRISTTNFRKSLADSPPLHQYLLRYAHAFSIQVAQTSLCNGSLTVEERIARWLLMCHDRADREDLPLTHEVVSVMLGVRRASVTTAFKKFSAFGAISVRRGTVIIQNRAWLLSIVGEAYGLAEATCAAVMGTALQNLDG